jgi:hypothetical protein
MRKIVLFVLAGVAVAATCIGVAWSAPTHGAAASGRHELHRTYYAKFGPSQECDGDSCGNGVAEQKLDLPDPGPYRLTITETFEYRTSGKAKFGVGLDIFHGATAVTPSRWALASTAQKTSATVTYRASVRNDRHYKLNPEALARGAVSSKWSITLTHVLITIDARPVPPTAIR